VSIKKALHGHQKEFMYGRALFKGANFKTFQFVQGQGRRKFQPQEYIEYFEGSAIASLRAKFEPDTEIGQNGVF